MPSQSPSPSTDRFEHESGAKTSQQHVSRTESTFRHERSTYAHHSDESTPLLSGNDEDGGESYNATTQQQTLGSSAKSFRSLQEEDDGEKKSRKRWPIIVALSVLTGLVLVILGLGFAAPAIVEQYSKEALVFEPTDLSIDSFTSTGVKARIRGDFTLESSRVEKKFVRTVGRIGTWIAQAVESKPSEVKIYLPEYGNILLGIAAVPTIILDIRDGHINHIDFMAELQPGDISGIRAVAIDWLDRRLEQIRVQAIADMGFKSGIFPLGRHSVSETLLFRGNDIPSTPKVDIEKFNIYEAKLPNSEKGMAVDVSLTIANNYPVSLTIPPLAFNVLVPGCIPGGPNIAVANATTNEIRITSRHDVDVSVDGLIRQLPDQLIAVCPESQTSPLDALLGDYIRGLDATIFVRGAGIPLPGTPRWITDLVESITVALPFPGRTLDGLIREFSLANVELNLPDPFADPNSPEAQPQISATVKALINLPKEMNFPIEVNRVRANADVFYHKQKLGFLDLNRWQRANSTRIAAHGKKQAGIAVESVVKKAPLTITDDDVFADVVQELIFGENDVVLGVKADVDVETQTAVGKFIIRGIPAEGIVPIKPLSGSIMERLLPKVTSLEILETTSSTLLFEAELKLINPTNYSASVPYVNFALLNNGTILGNATARNLRIVPGENDNLLIRAIWDPETFSDGDRVNVGRELLSQYISGYNTTITLQTHNNTIPTYPRLGSALSRIEVEVPTPRIRLPKGPNHPDDDNDDSDNDAPHFIEDATMHLISSTATFTLLSPLARSTIYITSINATAFYNHTDAVGQIIYDLPFAVLPGAAQSPRLPVDWTLDGVGYGAVKDALGGSLKLDAEAIVGVRVGQWQETVWYIGHGIGAHIRL